MKNNPINTNDSKRRLSMDRSVAGRIGTTLPKLDVPIQDGPPKDLLRESLDMLRFPGFWKMMMFPKII